MRFLRPEDYVLSIISGQSYDVTAEVLDQLRDEVESMNVAYYFSISDINPLSQGYGRISELAKLRNLALDPLVRQPMLQMRPLCS